MSDTLFCEALALVSESCVPYSGVLCGRATWKDGIQVYAREGARALESWRTDRGVRNIQTPNTGIAQGASPWWPLFGGRENIEAL